MPSIYLLKASMPDYYDIGLPFGSFRLALNDQETDDTRYMEDDEVCTFQGQAITAGQVRKVFAERDRRVNEDSERVLAANAARNEQLASRSGNAQRQRENALLAQRQKLTARIAWVEGELERVRLTLQMAEQKAKIETTRLTAIKCNAELALLEMPS